MVADRLFSAQTVTRGGRTVGVGENFCPTLPYNCPPRPWEPDPGPHASIADRVGTGGLACWPRPWEPDPGRGGAMGVGGATVGVGFHINVGHILKGVAKGVEKIATSPERLAVEAVKNPGKLIKDVGRLAGKIVKVEKFVLEQAIGIISLVPGLGTAIAAGLAAGLAALEGGGIIVVAIKIAYAAIPIPPGIKTFTDIVLGAVLDIVEAIVKAGTNLEKILERLIAEEMAKALPSDMRDAGTKVLAALTPTVLAALRGKGVPSLATAAGAAAKATGLPTSLPAAAAAAGLPTSLPAAAAAAGLPASLPAAAAAAGLPTSAASLPAGLPSIPGVMGVGDAVGDVVSAMQAQYAAAGLSASAKQQFDPIFNALVSMVHGGNFGPAILVAVRTGVGSKLPAGVARDVGLHVFDTLAHLILGKMFKGKPTQAQTAATLTKAQQTAIRIAAAQGQPLPAGVTPIAPTAAAYAPIAAQEKAQSTEVTVAVGGPLAYGPYPQPAEGAAAQVPAAPAKSAAAPASPSAGTTAATAPAAGTTAGVGDLGGGGGGGHGGSSGGRGWSHGGGRPAFRGRGWVPGWGGSWGGGPWWPYVAVADDAVTCATWGDPISFPAELFSGLQAVLGGAAAVVVRGADGAFYRVSMELGTPTGGAPAYLLTVRPCTYASSGVGSADDDVLKAMSLDLLSELRRTGAPQNATRAVKNFAQAWNQASADTRIDESGKYTMETQAALDAALSALAPGSGSVPAAVL